MPSLRVIALTATLLLSGCTCSRTVKETSSAPVASTKEAVSATPVRAHGMWVWGTRKRLAAKTSGAALLDSCRRTGVNEVYLSVNTGVLEDPALPELVTTLEHAGLRVEALMGEATWYRPENRPEMLAMIDAVAAYDSGHPTARFSAIHLDVEPHQLPENKGVHRFLPALAETLAEARSRAAEHGLATSADLPRFALEENGPAFGRVGVRLFVMLYELRDSSTKGLVSASKNVLAHTYAGVDPQVTSSLVVGLSVDDYPKDLEKMLDVLDETHGNASRYGGWAVHDEAKIAARAAHP